MKCDNHPAPECKKKTRDEPARCTSFGDNHPANFRGCKVLQNIIKRRQAAVQTKSFQNNSTISTSGRNRPPPASDDQSTASSIGGIFKEIFNLFHEFSNSDLLSSLTQDILKVRSTKTFFDKIPIFIDILQNLYTANTANTS